MIPKHSSFLYVFFPQTRTVECWLKFQDWSNLYFNEYSLLVIYIYIYIYMADNLEEESYGKISCIAKDVALFVVTPLAVAENW